MGWRKVNDAVILLVCSVFIQLANADDTKPYKYPGSKPGEGTQPYGNSTMYTRMVTLDADHNVVVKWDLDEENESILFHLFVRTHGWIGFGLSPNGGMIGSDIVIGWIREGVTHFTDRHAIAESLPIIDAEQNYDLLESTENDTHTIFKFKRKLDTCDEKDKLIDKVGTLRLIYAYGAEDPAEGEDILYHEANRGTKSVFLTPIMPEIPKIPDDAFSIDFKLKEFEVPEVDTTYICQIMKMPDFDRKHHVIKIEPLIDPGNEDTVHHIISYNCYDDGVTGEHDRPVECGTPNMPQHWQNCNEMAFLWAIGAVDFYFPEKAGLPFGGPGAPSHQLFELHYDNPQLLKGRRDASGLRFTFTPTLRQHDVAFLDVLARYDGPFWQIPPHFDSFTIFGHCSAECTKEGFAENPEGVTLIANMGHMHTVGRKLRFRHFRNGKELPIIDYDNDYDFNLQDIRYFSREVTVLPGDEIVTECTFDTSRLTTSVMSGLSTQEEMCIGNLMMYPKSTLVRCRSFTDIPFMLKYMLNITDVTHDTDDIGPDYVVVNSPPMYANMTFDQVLAKHVDWTDKKNRDLFQGLQLWGPYRQICQNKDGSTPVWDKLFPPKCVETYREPDRGCPVKHAPEDVDRCSGPNPFDEYSSWMTRPTETTTKPTSPTNPDIAERDTAAALSGLSIIFMLIHGLVVVAI